MNSYAVVKQSRRNEREFLSIIFQLAKFAKLIIFEMNFGLFISVVGAIGAWNKWRERNIIHENDHSSLSRSKSWQFKAQWNQMDLTLPEAYGFSIYALNLVAIAQFSSR